MLLVLVGPFSQFAETIEKGVTPPFVKNCTLRTNRCGSLLSRVTVVEDFRASAPSRRLVPVARGAKELHIGREFA